LESRPARQRVIEEKNSLPGNFFSGGKPIIGPVDAINLIYFVWREQRPVQAPEVASQGDRALEWVISAVALRRDDRHHVPLVTSGIADALSVVT
jgi:hypothetical protein